MKIFYHVVSINYITPRGTRIKHFFWTKNRTNMSGLGIPFSLVDTGVHSKSSLVSRIRERRSNAAKLHFTQDGTKGMTNQTYHLAGSTYKFLKETTATMARSSSVGVVVRTLIITCTIICYTHDACNQLVTKHKPGMPHVNKTGQEKARNDQENVKLLTFRWQMMMQTPM
jgi:hypothetical protein